MVPPLDGQTFSVKNQVVVVNDGHRGPRGLPGLPGDKGDQGDSFRMVGGWSSGNVYLPLDAVSWRSSALDGVKSLYIQRSSHPASTSTTPPHLDPARWTEVGAVDVRNAFGGIWQVAQLNHGFTMVGQPVAYSFTADRYVLADARTLDKVTIGVVREVVSPDIVILQSTGEVPGIDPEVITPDGSSWQAGRIYYASAIAGRLASEPPQDPSYYVNPVLIVAQDTPAGRSGVVLPWTPVGGERSRLVRQLVGFDKFYYEITGTPSSVSGEDRDGNTLAYEDGSRVEVFVNGLNRVEVDDYVALDGTSIDFTSALGNGDIVEIWVPEVGSIGALPQAALKLDQIEDQFTGAATQFKLRYGGDPIALQDTLNISLWLDAFQQEPFVDFEIIDDAGDPGTSVLLIHIPPEAGTRCWVLLFGGVPGADGRTIHSGTGVPNNAMGLNGDFYIDTDTWEIYGPKAGGEWPAGVPLEGPPGTPGRTILSGSGAPDDESDGANGDFYIDTTAWEIYGPKAGGAWPPEGVPVAGIPGADGRTILNNAGPPDNGSDGADGDFYIDTAAWKLYGPKAAGAWPAGVTLVGADGAPGVDGNTILSGMGDPNLEGENGDFYINVSTWMIFGPKAAGTWPSGSSLVGAPGADGRTLLNGSGAPGSGLGANGDFYIDTTAWEIYGPKAGGTWPAGVPLEGAAGVDGRTILSGSGAPDDESDGANGDFYIDTTAWEIYGPKAGGAWPPAGVPMAPEPLTPPDVYDLIEEEEDDPGTHFSDAEWPLYTLAVQFNDIAPAGGVVDLTQMPIVALGAFLGPNAVPLTDGAGAIHPLPVVAPDLLTADEYAAGADPVLFTADGWAGLHAPVAATAVAGVVQLTWEGPNRTISLDTGEDALEIQVEDMDVGGPHYGLRGQEITFEILNVDGAEKSITFGSSAGFEAGRRGLSLDDPILFTGAGTMLTLLGRIRSNGTLLWFGAETATETPPPDPFTAIGGTITSENRGGVPGTLYTFTASGDFEVLTGSRDDLVVEIISGGGSGGMATTATAGGGGSASRRVLLTGVSADAGTGIYPIVVGAGGAGVTVNAPGNDGEASSAFGTTNSDVGVGGGAQGTDSGNGKSGYHGSGGNGSITGGAAGIGSSGRNGGAGFNSSTNGLRAGGGGAGMGAAGSNGTEGAGGPGGAGIQSDLVDTPMNCCAGGGGAVNVGAGNGGDGGTFGGGKGSGGGSEDGFAATSPGSGGGGSRLNNTTSGAGADGIVRIWHPNAA